MLMEELSLLDEGEQNMHVKSWLVRENILLMKKQPQIMIMWHSCNTDYKYVWMTYVPYLEFEKFPHLDDIFHFGEFYLTKTRKW